MLKRLISLTLALTMCLSCAVFSVYADYPSSLSERELLKLSLDYIDGMDKSVYKENSYMTAFLSKLESAKTVYDNSSATATQLTTARQGLEKAKSKLNFLDSTLPENPLPFRLLNKKEVVSEMGVGFNLGNTMDGHSGFTPGETVWQTVTTTPELIEAIHDAGFNTVRIPVTWGNMIDDSNGYKINEAWINRVREIVDYCTNLGMYAIINIHHDGAEQTGWLRVAEDDIDKVYEKYSCVWRNIAEYFKDYDEHLIFEALNEVTSMEGSDKNSDTAKKFDVPIIVNLNQIFVNVVRSTGSNNKYRWLSCVSHYANSSDNYFSMPTDDYNKDVRLMYAAHIYKHSTKTSWTYDQIYEVVNGIKNMNKKYSKYPLILGEYGNRSYTLSTASSGWNDEERAYFDEIVCRACKVAGCVPCVWDQGMKDWDNLNDHLYSVWDRNNNKPVFKTITDAMMRGVYLDATSANKSYNLKDIVASPEITQITDITIPEEIEMTIGDTKTITANVTPSDNNDVVLWKSDNNDVINVSGGKLHAVGIGFATVHAYSQSQSVDKTMTVYVKPDKTNRDKCEISVPYDDVTVVVDKTVRIEASVTPSDETLMYSSSNPSVATVNALGDVVGISEGVAYVTVTAKSGLSTVVRIKCVKGEAKENMNLALHVLYNNSSKNYYGTELSEPVSVSGDGQYTVSFDLTTQQSAAGKKAGITDISNLTAIYIKDYDVTEGNAKISPVDKSQIRYDKVKVNDKELTINTTSFKEAVSGDIFDSGAPLNAWGGTVVDEVTIDSKNHVISFSGIENPTKVEVTFTLYGTHFREEESTAGVPATSVKPIKKEPLYAHRGDEVEVAVSALPLNTTDKITFFTYDRNSVLTDFQCVDIDSDGVAKTKVKFYDDCVVCAVADSRFGAEIEIYALPEVEITDGVITGAEKYIGTNMPDEFYVIIAVYDGDMLVSSEETKCAKSDVADGKISIDGLNIPISDSQNAKVFVWDSMDKITPLIGD